MVASLLFSDEMSSVIVAEGLTKRYGQVTAVDDLNLSVERNHITGLVGPNGAGKTTTIKMILGILRPEKGSVTIFGEDPWDNTRIRGRIGVVYERANFPPHKSLLSYLETVTRIFGVAESRAENVLEQVGLLEAGHRPVRALSAGMLQKFAIAHALVHEPEIIIADELTTNLDPQARSEILELVGELSKRGVTLLISSHILPELSRVCHSVAIMNKGKVWASGRLEDLYERFGANNFRIACDKPDLLLPEIRGLSYAISVVMDGQGLSVRVQRGSELKLYEDVPKLAAESGTRIFGIESRSASLEELFKQAIISG